jgi:hypothetical protein
VYILARLPEEFLKWNYYGRRRLIMNILEGGFRESHRFFIEFMRHNPVLCTACRRDDGSIEVNGKVVGIGYVVKRRFLNEKSRVFKEHLNLSDEKYREVMDDKSRVRELYREHSIRGMRLLLNHLYLDRGTADNIVDFEKLSTIELAARLKHSSKHTWNIVQRCKAASLVFFQPPSISYELKGRISIHLNDDYHRFVNLVHDAYHYTPPEKRDFRPVYIFHVEEVYDNSPTPRGYGRRIV